MGIPRARYDQNSHRVGHHMAGAIQEAPSSPPRGAIYNPSTYVPHLAASAVTIRPIVTGSDTNNAPRNGNAAASSFFKHQADTQIMKNTLLITCPRCGHRINGRLWRCPGCGDTDTDHKKGNTGKSRRGFRDGIIDALRARKTKAL